MFTKDQPIYYIDQDFNVRKGTFKGYIKICPYTQIIHIVDTEYNESILISEDFVFNNLEEAKKDLFEYEQE